ncbi:MAG: helix-turn-helix transcriptional regulator [Oscillospiraceae bacterium]|nr:helix-turn-helix transcriptional regulator [Oscillospiraceae bacterium]
MIDYAFIGARLKEARIRKNMTQEQLAAMTDVGSTYISHIETGMTIPSTKLLVQMMNILDCDPAEVLCMETRSARPALNGRLSDLVADCNEDEIKIITDTVTALKASLHRNRSEDK